MTGQPVSEPAIRLFRLDWPLSDIASLAATFRSPRRQTRQTDQAWNVFLNLLGGAPPKSYG